MRGGHADVVGAAHRIYHDAFEAITDPEADVGDTIIGYIAKLPNICKPKPPREVLAITPINFLVTVPKLQELLLHLPRIDLRDVIGANI